MSADNRNDDPLKTGDARRPSVEAAPDDPTLRLLAEEVSLKKIGTDHVETVHDKLRRQQVEIERVGAGGKVIKDTRV